MGTLKGKRVGFSAGVAGVAVLFWAGIALKDRLLEPRWISMLDLDSLQVRMEAAEKLGRIRSVKAIPRLTELAEELAQ